MRRTKMMKNAKSWCCGALVTLGDGVESGDTDGWSVTLP
jgi:hypothetical protein